MKLLNATQIRAWDTYSIQEEAISSWELMERAARECVFYITTSYADRQDFFIFCGRGNNGGDGLAIARLLHEVGKSVVVYVLSGNKKGSPDFEENYTRLTQLGISINAIKTEKDIPRSDCSNIVIVDALFGSGLNKPLEGVTQKLVEFLNQQSGIKISIDVPSGMYLDRSSIQNVVFEANITYTFQQIKYCFLLAENAARFGVVQVLNIGLSAGYLYNIHTEMEVLDHATVKDVYRPRNNYGHKGVYGHALLIAGNSGKMGALVMAARSCLRSGVGLLTCSIPQSEAMLLPMSTPESMSIYRNDKVLYSLYNAIGIGPGLGTQELALLKDVIKLKDKARIFDADALNMLSSQPKWLKRLTENDIITPHPKEFDRLFGQSVNEDMRIRKALALSKQYSFVIVLKGHHTFIAQNGKGYFNTTGNVGLATGGSGDTLTGIILSLLAQHYPALHAAILGVYLHGLAADIALTQESVESLIPTDLDQYLGQAFKKIALP